MNQKTPTDAPSKPEIMKCSLLMLKPSCKGSLRCERCEPPYARKFWGQSAILRSEISLSSHNQKLSETEISGFLSTYLRHRPFYFAFVAIFSQLQCCCPTGLRLIRRPGEGPTQLQLQMLKPLLDDTTRNKKLEQFWSPLKIQESPGAKKYICESVRTGFSNYWDLESEICQVPTLW